MNRNSEYEDPTALAEEACYLASATSHLLLQDSHLPTHPAILSLQPLVFYLCNRGNTTAWPSTRTVLSHPPHPPLSSLGWEWLRSRTLKP